MCLSNELSCETGSFSCCRNPHRFFQSEVLRLYFPTKEPWVARSVSLPSCSSQLNHTWMWDISVHQLPPHLPQSASHHLVMHPCHPRLPSPLLLLVWKTVSSYLLGFLISTQFNSLVVMVVILVFLFVFFYLFLFLIVFQVKLSPFFPSPSPPPHSLSLSTLNLTPLWLCPWVFYICSLTSFPLLSLVIPLLPPLCLLSVCFLFQCFCLYFTCLFVLLIRFHL